MQTQSFSLHADTSTGIAALTLNQPDRLNTLTPAFLTDLRETVETLDAEGQTRVLIINALGKHFCAGMALDVFASDLPLLDTSTARKRLTFQAGLRQWIACFAALDQARYPVICAIQGGCIGGGLDLAAACDVRVCSADAFFTVQEIHVGMAADLGSLQRLQRIMPCGLARQMAYTGERLNAERALACGLVNAVLPDTPSLQTHAADLAREIASKSPLAIAASKIALNHARDHGTQESLVQMSLLQSAVFDIDEMRRAIQAWQSKQPVSYWPLEEETPR
jgi:enoyl-CoA hydratase